LPPDRQSPRREEEDYGLREYTKGCRERRIRQRTARRGAPNVDSDAQRKEPVSDNDQGVLKALGRRDNFALTRVTTRVCNRNIGFEPYTDSKPLGALLNVLHIEGNQF
jgi:hypothetical protein